MALTKITRGLLNTGVSDSSDATAITIDANENVGIGTGAPSKKLHVKGDEILLEDPQGGYKLELNADTNPVTITANDNTGANYCGFRLKTNNGGGSPVTAMHVYPSGGVNVGFGTDARTDTQMVISKAPSSATQTTPETLLILSNPCTTTASDIKVGQGPRIVFEIPDDQSGNKATGAAIAALKENASDTNSETSLAFYTSDDDETLDQRMTILSDGKVGIGTTSPSSNLHISTTGETRLILEGDSDNDSGEESALIEFKTDGGAVRHKIEALGSGGNDLKLTAGSANTTSTLSSQIIFETKATDSSAAERMRIDSNGNVGIGSTPPSTIRNDHNTTEKALQVGRAAMLFSDTGLTTDLNNNTHLNNSDQRVSMTGTLGGSFYAQYNGEHTFYTAPAVAAPNVQSHSARFKIAQNGDLTATDTTIGSISDERLKKDIADYTGGLELVKNLRPRTFKFKDTTGVRKTNTQRGFIAQEVLAQDSYWISEEDASDTKDVEYDFTKDTEKRYLSKLHSKDAMYVSAIKELLEKLEAAEARIAALEG